MRRHIRIKNYILITVMLVLTMSLAIVTGVFIYSFRKDMYDSVKKEANRRAVDITDILSSSGVENIADNSILNFKITDSVNTQQGRVIIVDRKYMIVSDTATDEEGSFIIDQNIMKVMKGEKQSISIDGDSDTKIIFPIVRENEIIGVLFYKASMADVMTRSDRILDIGVIALLIILVIDFIIIRAISKNSVSDINDINEKIMHAALGNLQERLPENEGFVEIQVLSENYNEVLEKLATIDQTRSEFVSNVSHELKTPITSMKVLAESLTQNEAATAEEYKEFMTDIVDEIDRETKIINDLLTLVKTDSNTNDMNLEEVDINEMMDTIIKTVTPLAKQRNIDLSYESYKEVMAKVDVVKLSLAISNLIENAVKYNIDNGWIKCSLNADNRYFYIKVADSGVGIPEDAKERVFERFYRVDKARSRDTGGTGLGLAITRGIVNAHKGTIKLYSESGKGTTFTVKIPLDTK